MQKKKRAKVPEKKRLHTNVQTTSMRKRKGFIKKDSEERRRKNLNSWIWAVTINFAMSFLGDTCTTALNKNDLQTGETSNDLKIIESKVKKYLEINTLVTSCLHQHVAQLMSKFKVANDVLQAQTDKSTINVDAVLQKVYGGKQYHVYSHEVMDFDRTTITYHNIGDIFKEIEKSDSMVEGDLLDDNVCKKSKLYEETAGDDTVDVGIRDSFQPQVEPQTDKKSNVGLISSTETMARFCNASCSLPPFWGSRLHSTLEKITDPELSLPKLQSTIADLEDCPKCVPGFYSNCPFGAGCTNSLKLLRDVQPHFAGIRTLIRLIYRLRSANKWLTSTYAAIHGKDYNSFLELLDGVGCALPQTVAGRLSKDETENDASLDADVREKFGKLWDEFDKDCKDFPNITCSLCNMWFKRAKVTKYENYAKIPGLGLTDTQPIIDDLEKNRQLPIILCNGCKSSMKVGSIPALSTFNGMGLDKVLGELACLNQFELILIKQARTFQSIYRLKPLSSNSKGVDYVQALKGLAVHLPLPLNATHTYLQEKLPSTNFIEIIVDSCPTKKNVVWRSLVNTEKVYAALNKLKEINPLYENVKINHHDVDNFSEGNVPITLTGIEGQRLLSDDAVKSMLKHNEECEPYGQVTVEPIYTNPATDLPDSEIYRTMKVTSKPIFAKDPNTDLLCYPEMYPRGRNGMYSNRKRQVKPPAFLKHRFRNADNRFRRNLQYVFDELSRKYDRCIEQGIFALMNTSHGKNLTVGELREKLHNKDQQLEGNLSTLFANNRGSKEYWRQRCGDVQAMDATFGAATWFLTLSCAEFYWEDMREYLLHMNADLTPEFLRTSYLCTADPISVSSQFKRRFEAFLKKVLLHVDGPLGHVLHYFARIEYQARGAPHIHMKLWVDGAPKIGSSSEEDIITFIDKHIYCGIPPSTQSPHLHNLVTKFQVHKCGKTCWRSVNNHWHCRFGYPRKPTSKTTLFSVAEAVTSRSGGRRIKKLYDLRRSPNHKFINDYNPAILSMWQANMDLQYVGEESLILNKYITSYITKSERNATEELWSAIDENRNLRSRLRSFARCNMQKRETGAYEAADNILGHQLFYSSDAVRFVNTGMSADRKKKLKSYKELEQYPADSTNIYCGNMVDDYYPNRPDILEEKSLYQICRKYEFERAKEIPKGKEMMSAKNGMGYFRKRQKKLVIKTPYYKTNTDTDIEKYYHSLLMLFKPWRKEVELLSDEDHGSYHKAFQRCVKDLPKMRHYDEVKRHIEAANDLDKKLREEAEMMEECARRNDEEDGEEDVDMIAVGDPDLVDINFDELEKDISELNADQKGAFDIIIAAVERQERFPKEPAMKLLISGVAGTGKSKLILVVTKKIQSMFLNRRDTVAVLAPTGLAAFGIDGQTIHRFGKLPVQHSAKGEPEYWKLGGDDRKYYRQQWLPLKLIIVDEFSMVSNTVLTMLDQRLSECLNNEDNVDKAYGNKIIVMFGDLLQLAPVNANFCFEKLDIRKVHKVFNSVTSYDSWHEFRYIELTINMRQSGDLAYAEMLSRIRVGSPMMSDIDQLKARVITKEGQRATMNEAATFFSEKLLGDDAKTVCLLATNELVQKFNIIMLEKEKIDVVKVLAVDSEVDANKKYVGRKKASNKKMGKSNDIDRIKKKASDTAGLETELEVGVGARIMLRRNIDVKIGLVNGALGTVASIHKVRDVVYLIDVKFDDITQIVPIKRVTAAFEVSKSINMLRCQFPICLAYAITIHKSQGLTLNNTLVDLGKSIFEDSMAYVALSRVRNIENIHLIDFDPCIISCKQKAIVEFNRLRSMIPLQAIAKWNVLPAPYHEERSKRIRNITAQITVDKVGVVGRNRDTVSKNRVDKAKQVTRKTQLSIVKLMNSGVSCYCNALLQCLIRMPTLIARVNNFLVDFIHYQGSDTYNICRELSQFHAAAAANDGKLYTTDKFRTSVDKMYGVNAQQDIQEFSMALLEKLSPSGIKELFEFHTVREYKCTACHHTWANGPESNTVLPLHPINGKQPFKSLFNPMSTVEGNCRHCEIVLPLNCKETITFGQNQKYLVLILNLFVNEERTKTLQHLSNRKLSGFTANDTYVLKRHFRALGAILRPDLSFGGGHYTAWVRENNGWMCIDDMNYASLSDSYRTRFIENMCNVYFLVLELI